MKILLLLLLTTLSLPLFAADSFTLYLVRHAEKQPIKNNPSLTQCGIARSEQLATLLASANIDKIYSTAYARTRETATPLAMKRQLMLSNYSPRGLTQLAIKLKKAGENTLVVGHSNTTPQLASLLTGQQVANITEKEYQMLYQIHVVNDKAYLTVLKQPLICH